MYVHVHHQHSSQRAEIGEKSERQRVKIDRWRKRTDRFEVSEGHKLHNVPEDRFTLW